MSESTVSAAGGAMPASGHTTRRAALRLFGAAPALALPAAALADADLLALQPAIDAAEAEHTAALDALAAAEKVYRDIAPPAPPALPGPCFTAEEQQALDVLAGKMRAKSSPVPEWLAYERAVLAHEKAVERLKTEAGLTAAHELEDAAHEADSQVRERLIATRATTLAGLFFKARYAERNDYHEDVMASIVDDLLAMAALPAWRA
jgi:hypothetical protein